MSSGRSYCRSENLVIASELQPGESGNTTNASLTSSHFENLVLEATCQSQSRFFRSDGSHWPLPLSPKSQILLKRIDRYLVAPMLQLLTRNPDEIFQLELPQVLALCGNGQLTDGSACAAELRAFLKQAPSTKLFDYAETCLQKSFDKSGFVLQDLINEFGRRLDYSVESGLYQGRANAVGFDGLWRTPDGRALVVEVKTTDAYRINLDSIAGYRQRLINDSRLPPESSILIVVGRQDTGDLEAQVRGSRHAWDIRLISLESLTKLVKLKEGTEEDTVDKIRDVLVPFEYTRVDRIIDIAFTAATEATAERDIDAEQDLDLTPPEASGAQEHTPRPVLEERRQSALAAIAAREGATLVRRSRATYWSSDDEHTLRVACSISKRYRTGHYWYAYHPSWDDFLKSAPHGDGFFVLASVDRPEAYAIPREWLHERLRYLNQTVVDDQKAYWHIHLDEDANGELSIRLHKMSVSESLKPFRLPVSERGIHATS